MRLLYASSSSVPSRPANSVHVMKMCRAISKLGHEVRLLTLKRVEQEIADIEDVFEHYGVDETFEVVAKPFPSIPGRQLVYALSVWFDARRWKPDLVYGRYFPAMVLLGLLGYSVAWESHERVWDRSRLARFLAKRLFAARGFQKLVVISDALKQMYVDAGMIDEDRIVVAHDAADSCFADSIADRSAFRAGYIGGVYPGRGIELVMKCAEELSNVEFHFVGGTETDLRQLLDGDLPKNVVCHGYQPPERVPELRADFDVLLAPYQRKVAVWGGGDTSAYMSPLKIFEYMASNRPMICSDLPVLREVLNEENAILVQPDDESGWIAAIRQLQNDRAIRRRIAERALADFDAHYTWDIRAERILEKICAADASGKG